MKKILYLLLLLPIVAFGQSTEQNFTKKTTYKQQVTTSGWHNPVDTVANIEVVYYDGLGRPIQQVARAQSNEGKDIVTHIEYDAFGRQTKEYLPFPSTQNTLDFISVDNARMQTIAHYQTLYGENNPYSEKLFESSPLNRIIKQAAPGNAWAMGSGHEIKMEYLPNTAGDNVKYFKANASWSSSMELYDISITQNSTYPANQLYKTITKDENWTTGDNNTTQEFKNDKGQVVLKRTFNNHAHDTYYVYDQYGNLTYVLPPLAQGSINHHDIDGLGYQYKYDYRNRLVAKKLPGKQWEFIVYDKLDRPVATGPALSPRGNGEQGVIVTVYDAFDRVIQTGWLGNEINDTSRYGFQDVINVGDNNPFELVEKDILTKNFYDNYDFDGAPNPVPTSLPESTFPIATAVKGLATGSWVKVLNGGDDSLAEVSYTIYDTKFRPVRTHTRNYLGGYTQVDSKIDFAGKTEYTLTQHKRDENATAVTIKDMFTYDAQDRLILHKQIINNMAEQLIASNTYDKLGQLISKNVGGDDATGQTGLQKVNYTYNIRGWLKGINDTSTLDVDLDPQDLFSFKLNYNDPESANALYNGNISETYWRTSGDNVLRKYNYAYDKLNRMTSAIYEKPETATSQENYNELLSYDLNGNIKTLLRTGDRDSDGMVGVNTIDNLVYTYDNEKANQLMKVFDDTNSPKGFKDDSDGISDPELDYEYDANGNMIKDENKDIESITYNHLNLPTQIYFTSGQSISYIYNALGQKVQKTAPEYVDGFIGYGNKVTDYLAGGFQYKDQVLLFFPHAEGYVNNTTVMDSNNYNYVFNYTDHLGNVRLSYGLDPTTNVLKIMEENHYYPFGLKHTNYNSDLLIYQKGNAGGVELGRPGGGGAIVKPIEYKYKYNGKELQDELGLNVYDYGMMMYDPAIGRRNNIDQKAEQMRRYSPYSYCFNNPMRFTDPDGMSPTDVIVGQKYQQQFDKALTNVFGSEASNFKYDSNGKLSFSGDTKNFNADQKAVFKGLDKLMSSSDVTNIVYEQQYTITDNNGNSMQVDPSKSGGEATVLKAENPISENYVVIDPNGPTSVGVAEVTDNYYTSKGTVPSLNDPPNFKLTTVQTNPESVTFHGIGHVVNAGKAQDKVLDYDNKARNQMGLPKRNPDETHNKTVTKGTGKIQEKN